MDFHRIFRSLIRTPGFLLTAVLSLAVGIAAAASMFAVVHGVLLAPLPYGEPERLVALGLHSPDSGELRHPLALQRLYAQQAGSLEDVAFHRTGSTNLWSEGVDAGADSVVGTWVSASMMSLLQVQPLLGRVFSAEEELRGGPDAVILSEAEWRSRFGASRDVLGQILMVNSVPRQIIGVMPAGFSFPTAATRVWLPAKRRDDASLGDIAYAAVGRLAPGATPEQARLELQTLLPRAAELFPRLESGGATAGWLADLRPSVRVEPLLAEVTHDIAPTLSIIAAAAALVLLVALSNVATLLLIRADARQPELALRAALGAGRLRALCPHIAEAALLAAAGGALALPLAVAAVRLLVAFGPEDVPRLAELQAGPSTLAFTLLTTLLAMAVCAAVPAARASLSGLSQNLHEGGRSASAGRSRMRLRTVATALQIAVALAVTIGSVLLLRSVHALYQVPPGFDLAQVSTMRLQLPMARYGEAGAVDFFARLIERVQQLPSVQSAGVAAKIPLRGSPALEQQFQAGDVDAARLLPVNVVDAGYFDALSIPLLAGRPLPPLGHARGDEILLSRQAAENLFDDATGADSVGKRLRLAPSGPEYTVLGIVADVRELDLSRPPEPLVYRPLAVPIDSLSEPSTRRNMALMVKSSLPAEELGPMLRTIVRELDPAVAVFRVEAMDTVARASTARLQLILVLLTASAVITLLLSGVGLYGLMAFTVAQRTREFGVRMALGAPPARVAWQVVRRGLLLAVAGIGLGLLLYANAAPLLSAFLFGVGQQDPLTLAAASGLLLGVALLASWLPARRAARVDPAQSLRAE